MKFSTNGIGWLIVGVLICLSAVESYGLDDIVSQILLGLIPIAIYLMKQIFEPAGKGLFIFGGIFFAFGTDTAIDVIKTFLRDHRIDRDDLSTVLFAMFVSGLLLYLFYRRNKEDFEYIAGEMEMEEDPYEGEEVVIETEVVDEK